MAVLLLRDFMNTGLKYSAILHIVFILGSFIYISKGSDVLSTESIITVDLVNIKPGSVTNLKNTAIVKKRKKAKKNKTSKVAAPVVKTARKKNIVSQKSSTVSVKKRIAKNEIKINNNKDMDRVLDNLEKNFAHVEDLSMHSKSKSGKRNLAISDKPYDPSLPMSIAERDNIKMQIERKFFNPIVSDFNSGEIIIKIKLDMDQNGEIKKIIVLNSSSYAPRYSDAFVALRDSLVRAAHMASPLQGLDKTRYEGRNGWKEIELIFDAYYLMHT